MTCARDPSCARDLTRISLVDILKSGGDGPYSPDAATVAAYIPNLQCEPTLLEDLLR